MVQTISAPNRELELAPIAPTQRVAPERIGADTWLIHSVQRAHKLCNAKDFFAAT